MKLFDKIAPIYGLFFDFQVKHFTKIEKRIRSEIDISKYKTVLDIGCGTGALCKVLYEKNLEVVGVDPSKGMLAQANKRLKGNPIELILIDPNKSLPFEDKSFDLVIISYVVHGLEEEKRIKLYKEMKGLAKEMVIVYDYNEKRGLLTTIIEYLENGDYFNFIKIAEEEMGKVFNKVKKIHVGKRAAWYLCDPKD